MAKVHVKRNPDGSLSYLSDNLSWKPLVHGETRLTNSKGEPVLYDANRGTFVKEADIADYAKMGISQGYDALVRAGEQLGFYGEDTAQEWMRDTPAPMPDVMPSPEYRAASEKASEGILPAIGQAVAHPLNFTLPALAQSAPLMAVPLATTAAGLVVSGGNPLGAVAGAGIGSFAVNQPTRYNDVLKELAQQHGVDPASDQFGVFANNPQVQQEVQRRALAYAAPVAAIDALSMGMAGRATGAVKAIERARGVPLAVRSAEQAALAGRSIPGQVAKGVATQVGLGAGSEVAGQVSETGSIYDPAGVAMEGMLELPGGVAELSMSYLLGKSPATNPLEERVDQEAAKDIAPVTKEDFVLAAQKIAPNNVEAVYNQLIQSGPVGISVAKKARTAANLSPGSAGMEFQPRQPRDLTRGQQKAIGEISKANAAQAAKNESYNPKNPVGATFAPSRGVTASGGEVTQEGMAPPLVGRWATERAASLGLPEDVATQVGQKAAVSSAAEFNKKIVEYLDRVKRDPGFRTLSKEAREAKLKEAYDIFQAKYTYENKDLGISKPVLPSIQRKAKKQVAAPIDLELQEIVERNQINNQAAANPPGERHLGGDYMLNAIPEGTEEFEQARLNLINSPSYRALTPAEKAAAEKELYLGGKKFNEQIATADLSPSMTSTKPRDAAARANVSDVIEQLTASTRRSPNVFGNALKKSAVLDFPTKDDAGLQMYNQDLAANKGLADVLAPNKFRDRAVKQREEAVKRTMASLLKHETDTILKGVLQRMGLLGHVDPVVTLEKLANGAGGYVEGKTLVISALQPEGRSLISTINHESIHALRNLGLISVPEWKMLERAAVKGNWVSLYGFDTNPEYKNLGKEGLLEEAIAEHFSQTQRFKNDFQNENPHLVEKIRNRVAKFLGYLRAYINNILGVSTPEEVFDLFDRISSGELVAGRTPANKAFQNLDIVKFSKGLKGKIAKEKNSLVSALPGKRPENFKEDLRSATSRIGLIGWWFRDLQTHASRIPSLRPLFHISKQMEQKAHAIRSYATAKLVPILKWSKEDRASFSKAAAYLAINEKPLPKFTKPDGSYPDTFDIKLDSDFAGLGVKAGDTVTITPKLMQHLEVIDRLFSGLRKEHYLSTTWDVFGDALEKAGFTNLNMRNITSDIIRSEAKTGRAASSLSSEELGQLEAAATALEQIEKMSKHFHLPRVRQSPYFVTIYDKSQPTATPTIGSRIKTTVAEDEPYERIGTINLPTNMFGKLQSKASLLEYMNKRLEEFKVVHPGAFMPVDKPNFGVVDLTGIKSAAAARNFITAGQFDIFEQMALANEIPGLSNEERLALLQSMREAWAKRGFALHEKKSLGLQGYLHNDNLDNYVVGAGSVYASRAATTIAKNQYASSMNGARAELAHKAMTGVIHQSVREYADDYVNYVFSNQNEFAQLRSWMFNYFLGLNPSSAALNMLQVVHSSLPILTNMYGSPGEAAKALAKYTNQSLLSKDSFIRWSDPSNPNPYKDIIDKATDDLESLSEHERLIYDLIEKGTLRPHTVEEMRARDVALQLSGEKKQIEGFTDFANKAGNVFSFMFNRVEATTRVATALAAYDLAKKAKSSPAIKARLEKMLESTPWAGSDVNDASLMAEIAIELSHPDTTKFNRAKAFRGALAVPTQFLAFPVKMLDQYIGLFKQAFGIKLTDGRLDWSGTTPEARKAFAVLFLGLMATSGLSGAVPFGEPAKDAYDKLYKLITGIDPDIETELREALTDLTGSSMVAEMVDKGAVRALAGIDISQRVGVQTFSGVTTSGDILDLLGPAGSTVGTIQDAYNYWVSGHETLAMATLAPAAIRNPIKAMYANEYGVVSRQGNVLPTTYDYLDTAFQAVGFTPTKVSRAREEQFASNRLVSRTAVAKERAYDSLVALRVKSILARQRGNAEEEQEFLQEYRDYLKDLQASNQSAAVKNRVKIDMPTVTRRVMEQLRSINQGKLQQRRASPAIRREQANLAQVYPEH